MSTDDLLGVKDGDANVEGARASDDRPSDKLAASSVKSMLAHQVPSGAIYASMDFAPYRFCWLRDGSFTAFALDRAGEREASERFHRWAAAAIGGIAPTVRAATERRLAGGPNVASSMPPARYTVEGTVEPDGWPNFQVDGYGTWLWSLSEHVSYWGAKSLLADLTATVELVARYLEAVGLDPCYDCWEENGEAVHTSTLASVYGGLSAAAQLLGIQTAAQKAEEVAEHIHSRMRIGSRFAKSSANGGVDASLLWLALPFGVVSPADPAMAGTAAAIEDELMLDGGVRRYAADRYYGGGAWPLLAAWLGWYRARAGDVPAAQRYRSWVEQRFDGFEHLPEQVFGERRDPDAYRTWVGRWAHRQQILAWSHAMYFVLWDELQGAVTGPSNKPRAVGPPLATTRLAARAGVPNPPKPTSQGTLDQTRGAEKERG